MLAVTAHGSKVPYLVHTDLRRKLDSEAVEEAFEANDSSRESLFPADLGGENPASPAGSKSGSLSDEEDILSLNVLLQMIQLTLFVPEK